MKEVKLYECQHCHTRYASRLDAETCESNHKKPKKITDKRYLSYSQCQTGYPVTITVMFEDGSTGVYKR